jgi:hypothetical protein
MSPVAHDNSNTAAVWGSVTVGTLTKIVLRQPPCQIGTKTGRRKQPCYIACYSLNISSLHSVSHVIPKQESWIYGKCFCSLFLCVSDRSECNTEGKLLWTMKDSPNGSCGAATPQTLQNGNVKTPDFVDTIVWKVLSDSPFSRSAKISRRLVH